MIARCAEGLAEPEVDELRERAATATGLEVVTLALTAIDDALGDGDA